MDDITLFAKIKKKKQLKNFIQKIRVYSQDICMEIGLQNVTCRWTQKSLAN